MLITLLSFSTGSTEFSSRQQSWSKASVLFLRKSILLAVGGPFFCLQLWSEIRSEAEACPDPLPVGWLEGPRAQYQKDAKETQISK